MFARQRNHHERPNCVLASQYSDVRSTQANPEIKEGPPPSYYFQRCIVSEFAHTQGGQYQNSQSVFCRVDATSNETREPSDSEMDQ